MSNPPTGVYQVGELSPDELWMAHQDPRMKAWLTEHNIDYSTVYQVRMFSLGAWVSRYARDRGGHFYKGLFNSIERRLPLWVWQ